MTSLEHLLRQSAGVVSRHQMVSIGIRETDLRRLLRDGSLRRLRHGWYATASADPLIVRAVIAGGALTCLAALRRHGVWVPEHPHVLHARPLARGGRLSTAHSCRTFGDISRATSAVDDLMTSLGHAARCLDAEGFVVVCDSILNSRLASPEELSTALRPAPESLRLLLEKCDGRAQSGTETMVRVRLRARNITATVQHHIPEVGYVDLLVGKRLVIEVDSVAHHTGVERYETDRTRDRTLVRLGYLPIRFTYRQVVHEWADCENTLTDVIRRGDHRNRPRGIR